MCTSILFIKLHNLFLFYAFECKDLKTCFYYFLYAKRRTNQRNPYFWQRKNA